MKEVRLANTRRPLRVTSFLACLATVLELPAERLPHPTAAEDVATGWTVSRWLGGLGLGIVPIAQPQAFSWAGPWIAEVEEAPLEARYVVMYGVPSGVVWDPGGSGAIGKGSIRAGFLIAASDIALAMPPQPKVTEATGTVEAIWIAATAGEPPKDVQEVRAIPGWGLEGDRHVLGTGTFPSGLPGSALTLIEAEVCESFEPALRPHEHRRNVVTRGIDLNMLVGQTFTVGGVRCRGMRFCEPCMVIERYASRPVLRKLVHRGGLRADILEDGMMRVGDQIQVHGQTAPQG